MAKSENDPAAKLQSPVTLEMLQLDIGSTVALVGHPIHVMMVHFPVAFVMATLGIDVFYWWSGDAFWVRVGLWSAGFAFWTGVAASIVGTAELLLVRGIRLLEASWSHAVAAMTLVAIAGANWGLRLANPESMLPHGLALSAHGLGDGRLRRLARRQARVRSWRRRPGLAEEVTQQRRQGAGLEQVRGDLRGVDARAWPARPRGWRRSARDSRWSARRQDA